MELKDYIKKNHKTQKAFTAWWGTTEARVSHWVNNDWRIIVSMEMVGDKQVWDYLILSPQRSKRVIEE